MTVKELELATEILELRDSALKMKKMHLEHSRSFWSKEYPPAKKRNLHNAEISQMAADRLYERFVKYVKTHL